MTRTKDLISIHHASASWQDETTLQRWRALQDAHRREDALSHLAHAPNRALIRVLGEEKYKKLKAFLKGRS